MSGTIPTPELLRLAADMHELAHRLFSAAETHGDGAVQDDAFTLLNLARDMVRDNTEYRDQVEAELNRKNGGQ